MKVHKIRSLGVIYILLMSVILAGLSPGMIAIADTVQDGAVSGSVVAENASGGAVSATEAPANVTKKPTATKKPVQKDNWKIKKKKCTYPKKLSRGSGFTVKGILTSNLKMKSVVVRITNAQGKKLFQYTTKMKKKGSKKCYLSKADNAMKFSRLGKGTYYYQVDVYHSNTRWKRCINKKFSIIQRKWSWPVYGGAAGDGWHCHCSSHHGKHYGLDIKGAGRSIHATSDGTVVFAKYHSGSSLGSFGKLVVIYHGNGVYSYYAHCSSLKVKAGKKVKQGDTIATVGSTGMAYGPHLHFELRKGPAFGGGYNSIKLVDKYTYKQFNPLKKGYVKKYSY